MAVRTLCMLAVGVLAGCATVTVDKGGLATELLATDRAFAEKSERSNTADAFAEYVAPDAMQLPASGAPVRGARAIVDGIRAEPPSRLLWTPMEAEVSDDGSMGWTWGEWRAYDADVPPEVAVATGKYVNVWKRQPDGSWKVRVDVGNVARKPFE